jgi:hypothetical protein
MKHYIGPYLLPLDHPAKAAMDQIFSHPGVIKNVKTLKDAGFIIFRSQKKSYIRVLKHPLLKGYLLKIYLDTENHIPKGSPGWKRLTTRCVVAEKVKAIIARHKMKSFVVADKWVYPVPLSKKASSRVQPLVLIVKDMNIYNSAKSAEAWAKRASYQTARELFYIFNRGYGSAYLAGNLPYTHDGKFAFIDTEFDKRRIPMIHMQRYFSPKVRRCWQSMLRRKQCLSLVLEPLNLKGPELPKPF